MYLSTDLVNSVSVRASIPVNQGTFQSTDIMTLADEETKAKLVPLILAQMEEFYTRNCDLAITSGQASYGIPTRAIASRLREVCVIDPSQPDFPKKLTRIDRNQLFVGVTGNPNYSIQQQGFYLDGNNIVIYPTPTTTKNFVRQIYYCRPSSLVDPSVCGLITGINTGTNVVTVSNLPSNIKTSTLVDFVKSQPGFECTAIDQTITNIAGNLLTFATLPTNLSIGDYVCQANQTCIVQVPAELQPLLYQYTVVRVLSSQGDLQALQDARKELTILEENVALLISPRVDGSPKRVVARKPASRNV